MGLKLKVSEINGYLNQINSSLNSKNEGLAKILQGMFNFADATELTGDAWSAAKNYVESAHIPLLRGQIRANDEIMNDNLIFASRISKKFESGAEVNEDAINRIIECLEKQKQSIFYKNSLLENSPSFGSRNVNTDLYIGPINNQLYTLKNEIQSLHELESSCVGLYTTADSLLNNVNQGLSALSSTSCFNDSNGMYSTANLKLDWAKNINKEWKENFVLPYSYAKEVQKIKDDKNLSSIQKANRIAGIYEDFLYLQAKDAFDEYDKVRKDYGEKEDQKSKDIMEAAESKLAERLKEIDIDIKAVARKLGDDAIEVSGKNSLNYIRFIDMVNTKRPLDLKSRVWGDSNYSIWSRGWTKEIEDRRDYLGNYLFGYYGQGALLLNGETLKMGAGIAQIISDAFGGDFKKLALSGLGGPLVWAMTDYGDNPEDGIMVQEGIDDFKKYNKNN
ncbi:hypothetical protein I6N96_07650 [Enterococcus sp. BWM-S5]|uniref:LXG domain-containing protein n=1 Tax=Enterococcus larvae TaxID=2794352 RepID=A0ABS4CHQ2_9ENTE|nr:T7SS effector LXG polymorphic toxin [Enterococcus larvae]MBP1046154.1 hypothetical protein [Enterococcus larvae]